MMDIPAPEVSDAYRKYITQLWEEFRKKFGDEMDEIIRAEWNEIVMFGKKTVDTANRKREFIRRTITQEE